MSESAQEAATANYLKAMKDLGSPVLLVFGPLPGELLDSLLAGRTAYLQVHSNVDDTMSDGRRALLPHGSVLYRARAVGVMTGGQLQVFT